MNRTSRATIATRSAALLAAVSVLLAACGGSAAAVAPTPTVAPAASAAASGTVYQVTIAPSATLGDYLAGEDGKSLYLLTADSKDTTTCTAGCATAWPPFELEGVETVAAAAGVTGTLATITRADDGRKQVTYNGIPLYYFAKDAAAGDTNGQGIKGVWFLAAAGSTAASGRILGGVGQGVAAAPSPAASVAAAGDAPAVQIASFAFAPASITVKAGTSVTWTNADGLGHTITADDGSFDSGTVAGGGTFVHVFAAAGTYAYHCAIHSSMHGSITVTA